ncbi:MAG: EAL domain-containing protein, partial [Rhizobiaceae bacterium]
QSLGDVLVVDDDPILRAIAESHFEKRGAASVRTAGDGVQALSLLDEATQQPGFLLCDLNMPNMDGIEFLRHLEKRKFNGAISILSGEHDSVIALAESLAKTHRLNIVGTLKKPLNAEKLDKVIAAAAVKQAIPGPNSSTLVTVSDLRDAISSQQIVPYYQPKVDVRTGIIVGAEALARWHHPEWGMIFPGHFIPMAENYDLISGVTDIIFRQALNDVARWAALGQKLTCSVNLSVDNLDNISLPNELADRVDAAGLSRSQFVLEVTESSLLEKAATPMEVLARLRMMGFDLSIDDFGTGGSNIENLRDFPFSELKIDQSFVGKMAEDAFAQASVKASVDLGKQLGLRLVAEGVETASVRDFVTQLGVDQIQGYLVGKPVEAETFLQWLRGRRAS